MDTDASRRFRLLAAPGAALMLAALATGLALPARAAGPAPAADDFWTRDKLTGDWGGMRTNASKHGLDITFNYVGETLAILSGGFRQGVSYEHRFELSFDLDLDKAFGWRGATAHTTFYQIGHANGLPAANYVGSIADPSNIEALPSTRLFTSWFQQNFYDDKVSLRIGQIAADDEFLISPTASNLISSTFGYATILAANQLQGGPVYPLATPGIRLQLKPTEEIAILSAVFSGAPAGADCTQLPQLCNPYGTTLSTSGGALFMEELQYGINQAKDANGMPGIYKLGGWYATTNFADLHFGLDTTGMQVSLASPASAFPLTHQANWGIYGVADQMIWRAQKGPQSLNAFLRAGTSPSDRNLVESYIDGGIGLKAPLPGRDDDVLTFGIAYSKISRDAAALDLDYLLQLAPWWQIQADLQQIIHPGGNVPDPLNPAQSIRDAFVAGARTTIKF
jgi:porin